MLGGRQAADTGVWRSQLEDGFCPECVAAKERRRAERERAEDVRQSLTLLLGGEKPFKEYTFDLFEITPGTRSAFDCAKSFDPSKENLYFWGPCGTGKTHLACAAFRGWFEKWYGENRTVIYTRPARLMRTVRQRDPEEETEIIARLAQADIFVLDELGVGADTSFARQVFQEILDARDSKYRAGLIVTGKYSPDALAEKLDDDTIPSRLVGMCRVVELSGRDHRVMNRKNNGHDHV